jgi:uncharacterized protein (TIGR03083 family)
MEISEHLEALAEQGSLLADVAGQTPLEAAVPSCPGWQLRDLLRHTGYVHRWAARFVADQLPAPVPRLSSAEQLAGGPPDAELADWFRAGHAALLTTLSCADPGITAWAFLPAPSPLAFWARRQAHETAIHRTDAELAAGRTATFSTPFAADGIDELIMGFFGRDAGELTDKQRAAPTRSMLVRASDSGQSWQVALTADGELAATVRRGDGQSADCVVEGPAAGLYLLLWNRAAAQGAGVAVSGAADVLATWQASMRVVWSG